MEGQCLFISGSDGHPARLPDGRIVLLGNNDLYQVLGDPAVPRVQLTPDFFERPAWPNLSSYRCLINLISDPDRNPRVLAKLTGLLRGFNGRIVNRPSDVLRSSRDQVAMRLAGTPGLHVPKVVRLCNPQDAEETIERAGVSFPIILRRAGSHGGKHLGLFDNMDDLLRAVPGDCDLFATEFVDFRSADGLYRKFRISVFGRLILLRHMIVSKDWNVHGRDRKRLMLERADLRDEERRLLENPAHAFHVSVKRTLKAVRERIPLDYYGMDFGFAADGEVVLFEANAAMDFISPIVDPEFAYAQRSLPLARRAVREMIPELLTTTETRVPLVQIGAG